MSLHDDRGSSPVEFVLVGALLTGLTLAITQFALVVYVRNIAHDAAVEGAYYAALADVPDRAGEARAEELLARTVGPGFVAETSTAPASAAGVPAIEVNLRMTFPVVGLFGVPGVWEVSGRAPIESFE